MSKLVPDNFKVPEKLETKDFRLRMLTIDDLDKDYDAVMSSIDHLQGFFGPRSSWPPKNLTYEQDLIDLGWHQKEFQMRSSFAYIVMSLDEKKYLGCMYIFPPIKKGFDAEVYMWVKKSEYDKGLDTILYKTVKDWIRKKWPFKKVAYPGRDITWDKWKKLKDR